MAVIAFIFVAVATILSVDAVRIPVLNYLISHYRNSSIINFNEPNQPQATISNLPEILIPSGFSEVYSEFVDGLPSCMYTNDAGDFIMFYMARTEGKHAFDSEDAVVEEFVFLDYAVIYVCFFGPGIDAYFHTDRLTASHRLFSHSPPSDSHPRHLPLARAGYPACWIRFSPQS